MTSPPSSASLQQRMQINNQNNYGINGDGSYNIVTSGRNNLVNVTQLITAEGGNVELDRLLDGRVSSDALHNSFHSLPECYPNTRTTVRNEIGNWIDESGSKKSPLLWLNGPAAVGKSVIAKTISNFHDQIVATFFFSTSSDRSAATLFPTLAWQMARRIPSTREHIVASLKNTNSLQTSQIEEQFDFFIIQPLKRNTKAFESFGSRPVIVIDGVDECTDEHMLVRFLRVLVRAGEDDNMPVRFIICSRPEPRIHAILGRLDDIDRTTNKRKSQESSSGFQIEWFAFAFFVLVGWPGLLRMFGILQLYRDVRDFAKFHLLRLIRHYGSFVLVELLESYHKSIGLYIGTFVASGIILLSFLYHSRPEDLHDAMQQSRDLLQDVWELYRPLRFDVDKDGPPISTSNETLDTIRHHPVISTIQIGFSQECKDDIARYLTDKFNAIRRPREDASPWFQPSDISGLVEASCGQFLYASIIVRLLDDPRFDPEDVLEMAHSGSLPTPDLNKLYKAILKRGEDTIRQQSQEGGPDYHLELRFVIDTLSLLVFFAGNIHFFTPQKSFAIIEILLGLGKGKLNQKLSNMHSILNIVPGKSVSVYHRSFVEFLLNHKRSGEYHVAYSRGLQRTLILMLKAGFRYNMMRPRSTFNNNDDDRFESVVDMIDTCRKNFEMRSRTGFSNSVYPLFHLLIPALLSFFSHSFIPKHLPFGLSRLLVMAVLSLSIPGGFLFSLVIYTFFLDRSIIVPFFHPFFHPVFVGATGPLVIIPTVLAIAIQDTAV